MASVVSSTPTLGLPTDVCDEYLAGFCTLGEECKKRHSDVDIEAGDAFPKANVEAAANPEVSQGPISSIPRRKVCEDFAAGFCPNGDDCADLHDEAISPIASEVEDRGPEPTTDGPANGNTPLAQPTTSINSIVHRVPKRVSEDDMDIDELPSEVDEPLIQPPAPGPELPQATDDQPPSAVNTRNNSSSSSTPIASSVPGVAAVTSMPANGHGDIAESVDSTPSSPSKRKSSVNESEPPGAAKRSRKLENDQTPVPATDSSTDEIMPVNLDQREGKNLNPMRSDNEKQNSFANGNWLLSGRSRSRDKTSSKDKSKKNPLFVPKQGKEVPDKEKYHCKICRRDCNTPSNYDSHMRGKAHKQAAAKQKHMQQNIELSKFVPRTPRTTGPSPAQIDELWTSDPGKQSQSTNAYARGNPSLPPQPAVATVAVARSTAASSGQSSGHTATEGVSGETVAPPQVPRSEPQQVPGRGERIEGASGELEYMALERDRVAAEGGSGKTVRPSPQVPRSKPQQVPGRGERTEEAGGEAESMALVPAETAAGGGSDRTIRPPSQVPRSELQQVPGRGGIEEAGGEAEGMALEPAQAAAGGGSDRTVRPPPQVPRSEPQQVPEHGARIEEAGGETESMALEPAETAAGGGSDRTVRPPPQVPRSKPQQVPEHVARIEEPSGEAEDMALEPGELVQENAKDDLPENLARIHIGDAGESSVQKNSGDLPPRDAQVDLNGSGSTVARDDSDAPSRQPGSPAVPGPSVPPQSIPELQELQSSVLEQKMTCSHWKVLREFASQGSDVDKLTFKILQEFLVSPSIGIGFQHLAPFSKVMQQVPHRIDSAGNVVAKWADFPPMLTTHQDPEGTLQQMPSDMRKATLSFADNLLYQFFKRSSEEEGLLRVREDFELPSRGTFPNSANNNNADTRASESVSDDPLFKEMERLHFANLSGQHNQAAN